MSSTIPNLVNSAKPPSAADAFEKFVPSLFSSLGTGQAAKRELRHRPNSVRDLRDHPLCEGSFDSIFPRFASLRLDKAGSFPEDCFM